MARWLAPVQVRVIAHVQCTCAHATVAASAPSTPSSAKTEQPLHPAGLCPIPHCCCGHPLAQLQARSLNMINPADQLHTMCALLDTICQSQWLTLCPCPPQCCWSSPHPTAPRCCHGVWAGVPMCDLLISSNTPACRPPLIPLSLYRAASHKCQYRAHIRAGGSREAAHAGQVGSARVGAQVLLGSPVHSLMAQPPPRAHPAAALHTHIQLLRGHKWYQSVS